MIRIFPILSLLLITFVYFSCITDEGIRPERLLAPSVINFGVVQYDSTSDTLVETAYIKWKSNPKNSISTSTYKLLRYSDTSNIPEVVKNIPSSVNSYFDPVANLLADSLRKEIRYLRYLVIPVDSLNRYGDTSLVCSVAVAPEVELSSPQTSVSDSSVITKFEWTISKVINRAITYLSLWKNDSLLWESPEEAYFTGGNSKSIKITLPDSLLPLDTGTYHWSAGLRIESGGNDPESFTYRVTHFGK